jgi:hypothetical protein
MPDSILAGVADQISTATGKQVVYNKKSGTDGTGSSASDGGAGTNAGTPDPDDNKPVKRPNDKLEKGDRIDLERFSRKVKVNGETRFEDPKSGYQLVKDRAGGNSHGGSAWKLIDRTGNRIGTLSSKGIYLRG